jgi:type IV pilus assembly protein PilN
MIRINLLPAKESAQAIGQRQQRAIAMLGGVVALMIMVLPYLLQAHQLGNLERETKTVQEEIKRFDERVKEVRDLDKLKAELQTKLRIIDDLNNKRVGPARVLGDLSVATPENLWLVDFKETANSATITGLALDNQTIALFMRQLQSSPYFHRVDLVETTQSSPARGVSTGNAPSFKRFIINAGIDYFGRGGKPAPIEPGTDTAAKPGAAAAPAKPSAGAGS